MVFVDVSLSLDGYLAGPNAGPENPLGDGGMALHRWMYGLSSWRERMGMAEGDDGADDALVRRTFERAGAYVMGRRMFDEGEAGWPETPPFRAPVFVVTHGAREEWVRPGGTTFTFITDGVTEAVARAREAAGGRDVRIAGGGDLIRQCLRAGLVDQVSIHLAPVLLGCGVRLFEGLKSQEVALENTEVTPSWLVTHLDYVVANGDG